MNPDAALALSPTIPTMTEAKPCASWGDTLEGFLGEHGRCWRVSGEDLRLIEDRTVLWLTCPGCEAAMPLRDVPRGTNGKA